MKLEINQYKSYLQNKFTDLKFCAQIVEKHNQLLNQPDYACLYCKEIDHLLKLSKYNCSFKSLTQTQLSYFGYDLSEIQNSKDEIILIAILSSESLTEMIEHHQYLFIIKFNILNHSIIMSDHPPYYDHLINIYDPILSKSRVYKGHYKYEKLCSIDQELIIDFFNRINQDNFQSLPKELVEYYNNIYQKCTLNQKKDEIRKVLPCLQKSAIDYFSKSNLESKVFIYIKYILSEYMSTLFSSILEYRDLTLIKQIFTRLTPHHLNQLINCQTPNAQYVTLLQIFKDSNVGWTPDEIIDLTINQLSLFAKDKTSNLFKYLNWEH